MNYAERFRTCRKCNTDYHISLFRFVKLNGTLYRARVCNLCFETAEAERAHKAKGKASPYPSIFWWHYQEIMELGSAGASPAEIYEAIGKPGSIRTFRNWLRLHKIPRGRKRYVAVRQVPDELLEAIRERLHRRLTYGQIAQQLDISRNRVAGYVHNYRLRALKERPAFFHQRDAKLAASAPRAQPGDRPSAMPSPLSGPDLPSGADRPVPLLSDCS